MRAPMTRPDSSTISTVAMRSPLTHLSPLCPNMTSQATQRASYSSPPVVQVVARHETSFTLASPMAHAVSAH